MGQVLHGSAKTTHAIRAAIQRSQASIKELIERWLFFAEAKHAVTLYFGADAA